MRLHTFITFFSYQNIRSLPPYLSIPLFDLTLTVAPLKQFTLLHAIWDIECRRVGLSPARPIPFYLSFSLVSTHLLVAYLFLIASAQTYKYPCACLAEKQATVAQDYPSFLVCVPGNRGPSLPFPIA